MSDNTFPTYIDVRIDEMKLIVKDDMMSVTPEIVAEMFASMDSEMQARFFNHVDEVAHTWRGGIGALCFQLQSITDEDGLTYAGRRVMQEIGEYSHWGLCKWN